MKVRLDVLLPALGMFPSRSKAVMAIEQGAISVNGIVVTKPSELVEENSNIQIVAETLKYVSRGGLKLEKAIDVFGLNLKNKVVLDMGSSTGGFTDCALQYGAKYVYAVDIGTNQLADVLRINNKVESIEKTDVKTLSAEIFNKCDVIVGDLSFVSIVKIVESIIDKIKNQDLMLLIKPQFECGITIASKGKGVIRDKSLSERIARQTILQLEKLGLQLQAIEESPIAGGDGNTEYIAHFKKK